MGEERDALLMIRMQQLMDVLIDALGAEEGVVGAPRVHTDVRDPFSAMQEAQMVSECGKQLQHGPV